ncbi:MAG: amidohydrolase [Candidatus Blackburnbacteria bacterium]|nr:amidohydrolase [Candidatus Blackburnbacteria bacterium]
MIIDSHAHIALSGSPRIATPDDLIKSMDEAGIDYSLLLANQRKGTRISTNEAVEIAKKYPRIKAIGHVEFGAPIAPQIENLKRYLNAGQIHGVKFYLGYEDYSATDKQLFPLYEFCQKEGKPIIFHTGALLIGEHGMLKNSHPLNVDDVAYHFPNLKIVIAHMGNPWIIDTAAILLKNPNVYTDLSGYFTEWVPIDPGEAADFKNSVGQIKSYVGDYKKCIFGTDWPLYSQKEYIEAVKSLDMSEEEKELVFWKNANDIFSLGL